jgi:hypothetical protein
MTSRAPGSVQAPRARAACTWSVYVPAGSIV